MFVEFGCICLCLLCELIVPRWCVCVLLLGANHLPKLPKISPQGVKTKLKSHISVRENENALQTVEYESADPAVEE